MTIHGALTCSRLAAGQRLLGCIREVRNFELLIALPNRLFGTVPCNRISPKITALFTAFASSDDSTSDEAPSLTSYFRKGEFVICSVMEVRSAESGKRSVELSLDPSDVLRTALDPNELVNGLLLPGMVLSKEDRGWLVDLGGSVSGFCAASKTDEPLIEGKVCLFTLLLDPSAKTRSPILQLSAKVNRLNELFLKFTPQSVGVSKRLLLPGNLVDVAVMDCQETRLIVDLAGTKGIIERTSLIDPSMTINVRDRVRARIAWSPEPGDTDSYLLLSGSRSVLSLSPSEELYQTGARLEDCSVMFVDSTRGIVFQLPSKDHRFGFAHMSRLFDDSERNRKPLTKIPSGSFKEGQKVTTRVIGYDLFESIHLLSCQSSILNAPFISYSGLQPGSIVKGTVQRIADFGLLVELSSNVRAVCPVFHLSDSHAASSKYLGKYSVGQSYKFRVLDVDVETKKVTLSRRKALIDSTNPPLIELSSARPGQTVDGFVISVKEKGVVVRFYSGLCGLLPVAEMSDTMFIEKPEDVARVGQSLTVKVKSVDPIKRQLILSLRENPMVRKAKRMIAVDDHQEDKVEAALERPLKSRRIEEVLDNVYKSTKIIEKDRMNEQLNEQLNERMDEQKEKEQKPSRLMVAFEELAEKDIPAVTENKEEGQETAMDINKQKVKVKKDISDDFEKRLLATPNAAIVWIEYAAALIATGVIDAARSLFQRALLTISIREEAEKLNVWTAWLNTENIYGSSQSLKELYHRACQYNDPKSVSMRLLEIYGASGKRAEAEELLVEMQKKSKGSCKVWLAAIQFHLQHCHDPLSARKLLPVALKALPFRKHSKLTLRVAQLEYKQGDVDRARSLFESLLANDPRRIDLWSIYLQMEENLVKHLSSPPGIQYVRRVYERTLSMKLSSKKAKFFFKNYLSFEKAHGDAAGVEHVKQLARDYVDSK